MDTYITVALAFFMTDERKVNLTFICQRQLLHHTTREQMFLPCIHLFSRDSVVLLGLLDEFGH